MIGRYTERKIRKEISLQETGAIPPVEDNAKAVRVTWESLIGDPSVPAPLLMFSSQQKSVLL